MKRLFGLLLLTAMGAWAAPLTVSFTCTPSTTRSDGTALSATQIGGFNLYQNGVKVGGYPGTTCAVVYTIPGGSCIKATDVLTLTEFDTSVPALESAPSTPVSLSADRCSPLTPPAPPTNVQLK